MGEQSTSDVLYKANLYRQDRTKPWGFRLQGGFEFNKPLTLLKVMEGSVAARGGLTAGDVVVRLCGRSTLDMTHQEAQSSILNSGNSLEIVVERPDRPDFTDCQKPLPNNLCDNWQLINEKPRNTRPDSFASEFIINQSAVSLSDVERSRDSCKQTSSSSEQPTSSCLTQNSSADESESKICLTREQKAFIELQQKQLKLQQLMQQGQLLHQQAQQQQPATVTSKPIENNIDKKNYLDSSLQSSRTSESTETNNTNSENTEKLFIESNTSAIIPHTVNTREESGNTAAEPLQANSLSAGGDREGPQHLIPQKTSKDASAQVHESSNSTNKSRENNLDVKSINSNEKSGQTNSTSKGDSVTDCAESNNRNENTIKDHNANIPESLKTESNSASNSANPEALLLSTDAVGIEPSDPSDVASEMSDETVSVIEAPISHQADPQQSEQSEAIQELNIDDPREDGPSIKIHQESEFGAIPANPSPETEIFNLVSEQETYDSAYSEDQSDGPGFGSLPANFKFSDAAGLEENLAYAARDFSQTAPWRVTSQRVPDESFPDSRGRHPDTAQRNAINIPISILDESYRRQLEYSQQHYNQQDSAFDDMEEDEFSDMNPGLSYPDGTRGRNKENLSGLEARTLYSNTNSGAQVDSTSVCLTPVSAPVRQGQRSDYQDDIGRGYERGYAFDPELLGIPLPTVRDIVAGMNRQRNLELQKQDLGRAYGSQCMDEVQVMGREEPEEVTFRRSKSLAGRRSSSGLDGEVFLSLPPRPSENLSPHRSALKSDKNLQTGRYNYPPSVAYNNIIYTDVSPRSIRRYSLPSGSLGSREGQQRRVRFADPPASSVIEIEGRRQRWPSEGSVREEELSSSPPSSSELDYNSVSLLKERLDRIELENALASAAMKRSRPFQSQPSDLHSKAAPAMGWGPPSRSQLKLDTIPERLINVKTGEKGAISQQIKLSLDSETVVYESPNGDFTVAVCPDKDGKLSLSVRQKSGTSNYEIPAELKFVIPTCGSDIGGNFSYSISNEGGRMYAKESPANIVYDLPPSYEDSIRAKVSGEHPRNKSYPDYQAADVLIPPRVSDLRHEQRFNKQIPVYHGDNVPFSSSSAPSSPVLSPRHSPMMLGDPDVFVPPSVAAVAQRLERLASENRNPEKDLSAKSMPNIHQESPVQIRRTERVTKMQPGSGLRLTTHKPQAQLGPAVGAANSSSAKADQPQKSVKTATKNNSSVKNNDRMQAEKSEEQAGGNLVNEKTNLDLPERLLPNAELARASHYFDLEPEISRNPYRQANYDRGAPIVERISPSGSVFEYQINGAVLGADAGGSYRLISSVPLRRDQARRYPDEASLREEEIQSLMASLPPSGISRSKSGAIPRQIRRDMDDRPSYPQKPFQNPNPNRSWGGGASGGLRRAGGSVERSPPNPYSAQDLYVMPSYLAQNLDAFERRWSVSQKGPDAAYYDLPPGINQPSQSAWDLSRSASSSSDIPYVQRLEPRAKPPQGASAPGPPRQPGMPPGIFAILDKTFTDKVMQWQSSRNDPGSLKQSATYKLVREMDEEMSQHDF